MKMDVLGKNRKFKIKIQPFHIGNPAEQYNFTA